MIKQGRIPTLDYDLLIYVKSDNSLWVTPQNPVELYGEDFRGYNWHDDRIIGRNITDKDDDGGESWPKEPNQSTIVDVARCIKPINPEFEVRWSGLIWGEADGQALENASFAKLLFINGEITIDPDVGIIESDSLSGFSPTNIIHAKMLYPEYAWIITNSNRTGFRIINPFNPRGNGLVVGVNESYISTNYFLSSTGKHQNLESIGQTESDYQSANKSPLIFDSYSEFKLWYQTINNKYTWKNSNGITKPGRDPINDYDRLIYVIDFNHLWLCPSDPRELNQIAGSGWGEWGDGETRRDVPYQFKFLNSNLSVSWALDDFNWSTGISSVSNISAAWKKIIWNDSETFFRAADVPQPTDFEDAKKKFPDHSWVIVDETLNNIAIINPYNNSGAGFVYGPTFQQLMSGYYLKSDGSWDYPQNNISFSFKGPNNKVHERLLSNSRSIFNRIKMAIDIPISSGRTLKVELYKKFFDESENNWVEQFITDIELTANEGVESFIKTKIFDNYYFSDNEILVIKYIDSLEGSNNYLGTINVSIYYTTT